MDQGGYDRGGPRKGWVTVEPELTQRVTEQGPNTQSGVGTTVYSAAPIRHFTESDLILKKTPRGGRCSSTPDDTQARKASGPPGGPARPVAQLLTGRPVSPHILGAFL